MQAQTLPPAFYYALAYEYLHQAYSQQIAHGFTYKMDLKRRPAGVITVECFNGGAFVKVWIDGERFWSTGDYRKHRRINYRHLMNVRQAMLSTNTFPKFYEIKPQGYDVYLRFVHEKNLEHCKELAKLRAPSHVKVQTVEINQVA